MEDELPPYSCIHQCSLQWKSIVMNNNVYQKLVLKYINNDNNNVYIDNDFGEYVLSSTYRINPKHRKETISGRNSTISYGCLEPFSYNSKNDNKNTVMVRRIPASFKNEEINFVDSQHMSRNDVIKVVIPPREGFENVQISVYSPFAAKLSNPITEFKGRLYSNAKIILPGTVFEQNIDVALEVDQIEVISKDTGKYDVVNVTVLYVINRNEFDMIKFFTPNTAHIKFMTIHGEASRANLLEGPSYDNGRELFFPKSQLFLKILKNKGSVRSTSELPSRGKDGKECIRTEIEVMTVLKNGNFSASERFVLFNDVVSDSENVYIILDFKQGLDANNKLNNYNLQLKALNVNTTSKSEVICKKLLKNVSTALYFMHSQGICHNDIKLENIVSAAPLDSSIEDWIKDLAIVDFGQARRHCINPSNSTYYPLPWLGIPGTPNYYCPETLQAAPYDGFKVDVFQLAMTMIYFQSSKLYEKFRQNFDEYRDFLCRLKSFGPVHFINLFSISQEFKNLLIQMLDPNPSTRISIKEVCDSILY